MHENETSFVMDTHLCTLTNIFMEKHAKGTALIFRQKDKQIA